MSESKRKELARKERDRLQAAGLPIPPGSKKAQQEVNWSKLYNEMNHECKEWLARIEIATHRTTEEYLIERGASPLEFVTFLIERSEDILNLIAAGSDTKKLPPLACRVGCDHCCRGLKVEVWPWEAAAIAEYLVSTFGVERAENIREQCLKNAQRIFSFKASDSITHARLGIVCPLLDEGTDKGLCSVYSVRPISCVSWHSYDSIACAAKVKNPSVYLSQMPLRQIAFGFFTGGITRKLNEIGRRPQVIELNAAMYTMLTVLLSESRKDGVDKNE